MSNNVFNVLVPPIFTHLNLDIGTVTFYATDSSGNEFLHIVPIPDHLLNQWQTLASEVQDLATTIEPEAIRS